MKKENMVKVDSSNILAIGYENDSLFVQYPSGIYQYDHVPKKVFDSLNSAESKGQFMNANVKSIYACSKVSLEG